MQVRTQYFVFQFNLKLVVFNARHWNMRDQVTCSRANRARKEHAALYVSANNNNSDSGYFAYPNNRMLSLPFPSWCTRCFHVGSEAARTLRPEADASRFAWQVTRNLFACQRTRLSPLIPSPRLLRTSKRFTYLPFTRSCFWSCYYRSSAPSDL